MEEVGESHLEDEERVQKIQHTATKFRKRKQTEGLFRFILIDRAGVRLESFYNVVDKGVLT